MEDASTMVSGPPHLNQRIAQRVRDLRGARKLSLEALASASGVSRSMISLIERGESSPTAVVLDKLASALGVTLASVFDPADRSEPDRAPVARRADQPTWQDPGSGYIRRSVSPPGQPAQIVEVQFPPGGRVAFETAGGATPPHQQVWIVEGRMAITIGTDQHLLRQGDCLAMRLDGPTMFHNPTKQPARYVVVVVAGPREVR